MTTTAIILASGSGTRFGGDVPKQFISLHDRPVYQYAVDVFLNHPRIDNLILVVHPDYQDAVRCDMIHLSKPAIIVQGGATRQESAYCGLQAAKAIAPDDVLIHDAARPNISAELIDRVLDGLSSAKAVSPVISLTDTLYEVKANGSYCRTVSRDNLRRVQTPQGFSYSKILQAHELAILDHRVDFTDDVALIDAYQLAEIVCVDGDTENIKMTNPSDESYLTNLLSKRKS